MKKRSKVLFRIINFITLAVPVPLYLLLLATVFSVTADYTIQNAEIDDLSIVYKEDRYLITTDNKEAVINGIIAYDEELGYALVINEEDILKVDRKFYNIEENELKEIDVKKLKKEEKYHWSIPVIVGIITFLIVGLVISGKMQWQKKYPKFAVLLSLGLGTMVLYFINMIATNMFNIFLIALISWVLFMIEEGVLSLKERSIREAEAERTLQEAIKLRG